jgi:crotonobetainyl-CoA:carnitine CoA-transferase CaiB-like acyl-CoA transferase
MPPMSEGSTQGPLAGVRVVDLTSVILGPYATQQLADLGADVIKVEPPAGDNMRYAAPVATPGLGHIFLQLNRNKRAVVLDLKHPDGRAALLRLAAGADVLVHNVRPAAMERLGLAYDDVRAVNETIVYVGASGFRPEGPYGEKAAYDDIIQGLVALPSLIADQGGGRPRYVPSTICDRVTGLATVNAITAALFARERTGKGQEVAVTMFETMAEFVLSDHLGGATWEPPAGPMGYPRLLAHDRSPYRTKDGTLCVLIYNDKQWRSFAALIGRPELMQDGRFATQASRSANVSVVLAFVAAQLETRTTDEWLEAFAQADIPAMPLHTLDSLLDDPHLGAVGFFQHRDHPAAGPIRMLDVPSRWSETPPGFRRHAPLLGEHSVEVLKEAGYSDREIDRMLEDGVTAAASASEG